MLKRRVVRMLLGWLVMATMSTTGNAGNLLKTIASSGEAVFGYRTDAPPFSFLDEQGVVRGLTIDVCEEVGRELKKSYPDVNVRWVPVTSTSRFEALMDGQIHLLCGATTVTLERQDKYRIDFSYIVFITGARLMVKANSGVKSEIDLHGRKVGVLPNTTTEKIVLDMQRNKGWDVRIVSEGVIDTHSKAVDLLINGEIDAYAGDEVLLSEYVRLSKSELKVVGDILSYEPYALAMPYNESEFRYIVNKALVGLFTCDGIGPLLKKHGVQNAPGTALLSNAYKIQAIPEYECSR